MILDLVGGLECFFPIIYGIILPIDFHIFQDGWNHQPEMIDWGMWRTQFFEDTSS